MIIKIQIICKRYTFCDSCFTYCYYVKIFFNASGFSQLSSGRSSKFLLREHAFISDKDSVLFLSVILLLCISFRRGNNGRKLEITGKVCWLSHCKRSKIWNMIYKANKSLQQKSETNVSGCIQYFCLILTWNNGSDGKWWSSLHHMNAAMEEFSSKKTLFNL